ncbi:MAG: DUF4340 domain-containing protein [Sandaracinaceae bacterium]|nr:DUF4340 domain-containing protein [Sandaracinaceae bacterium]
MRKQTTLVLAGITAVMLGFIVFYEQDTLSSGELESRRGQVLDRFVRPRVHAIRIERPGGIVVALERDQEAVETLDTFDVGTWRLIDPVQGPADPDAIDGVLLACESLSARRSIEHASDEDRARFGLDSPRLVLTLGVADETQTVRVGDDDEALDGTYVEVEGTGTVHLVGQDFFEALDREVDDFRSRDLFEDLATRDVTALTLRYGHEGAEATEARVAFRDHRWVASAPFEGWARQATITGLVDALVDARVARYVHEGGETLLSPAAVELELTAKERDDEGRDTGRLREHHVVLGRACPEEPTTDGSETVHAIALRVDDGPVVCVASRMLEAVTASEASLRETRLVAANDDQVERVVFGHGDEATLEVRRHDDRWELREEGASHPADDQAVSEFLGALHGAEAESFEAAEPATLASRGLDAPRTRIRVHHSDDPELVEYIDVGALDTIGVWVRRGDEPVIARYVGSVADLLQPSALRFRSRSVIAREADDVLGLSITRDGQEERLSTENGAWRIEAPFALAADRIATRDLLRALVALRAARWVAEEDEAEFGLASPRIRVQLSFRDASSEASQQPDEHDDHGDDEHDEEDAGAPVAPLPTSLVLLVGADADGGAYARLEGEAAVFVLPSEVLASLRQPLVDREIIALDTTSATRITLTSAGASITIEKRDGVWYHGEVAAAPDATQAFVERLRSLRARGVSAYGATIGFTPTIAVSVEGPGGTRRLDLGGSTGEGETAWAPARVSDVSADLQISAEIAAALASYRP